MSTLCMSADSVEEVCRASYLLHVWLDELTNVREVRNIFPRIEDIWQAPKLLHAKWYGPIVAAHGCPEEPTAA